MNRIAGVTTVHHCRLPTCVPLDRVVPAFPQSRDVVWLDSAKGDCRRGRLAVLAICGPTSYASGRSCRRPQRCTLVDDLRGAFGRQRERAVRGTSLFENTPFVGGWVGYLAYEAMTHFDPAFPDREDLLPYPLIWFRESVGGITVDADANESVVWAHDSDLFQRLLQNAKRAVSEGAITGLGPAATEPVGPAPIDPAPIDPAPIDPAPIDPAPIDPAELNANGWVAAGSLDTPWPDYETAVNEILDAVHAGDVYQVNLTTPAAQARPDDPLRWYQRLRAVSPADYMAYVRWPGLTICSSSPELFFSNRKGELVARPMKGTRPATVNADLLRRSAKDRAENVMIVDLMRNDLGRVAEIGTVNVTSLCDIETYATVHQMTSTITAALAGNRDVFDALKALFPPGSMTGAPKVQATKIIRRLEPVPRGIYSGSIGLIDWSGNAVFNVVIRSLVSTEDSSSWPVGGGIVADSHPLDEYREARTKLVAIEQVSGTFSGDTGDDPSPDGRRSARTPARHAPELIPQREQR